VQTLINNLLHVAGSNCGEKLHCYCSALSFLHVPHFWGAKWTQGGCSYESLGSPSHRQPYQHGECAFLSARQRGR